MSLCAKCGKDNREGSRFCQSCGTPLAAAEAPRPQAGPTKKRSSQELAPAPVCSACGTLNAPGMKFCKMCGSPLEAPRGQAVRVSCPSCGGHTPSGFKFCQHCGTPLPKAGAVAAASAAAPVSAAASEVPAPVTAPASAPAVASLTTPAGASPFQVEAVMAAARPAPISPGPLQAVLSPAAELVEAAASTPPDQARTIIEVEPPRAGATAAPRGTVEPASPALIQAAPIQPAPIQPAPIQPAPIRPGAAPVAASGSIQTPATPPAGMPAGSPRGSKPTVGARAGRSSAETADPERRLLARLVTVNRDGTDGEVHAITEECFDLGRTAGHLVFNDDPYLSDRHCRFCIRNDRWLVQDLQSCNGVFLRVDKVELRHGDRLLLGKQVLTFELLGEHERALAPAVEHGVLVFGSPLRTPWGRLRQLTVAGIYRDVYYLYRPRLTIGREEGDWIFPDDEFMSRQHLSISLAGTRAELQDLQSSNGTFVQIREPHELQAGALIRVGDQLLRFEPV